MVAVLPDLSDNMNIAIDAAGGLYFYSMTDPRSSLPVRLGSGLAGVALANVLYVTFLGGVIKGITDPADALSDIAQGKGTPGEYAVAGGASYMGYKAYKSHQGSSTAAQGGEDAEEAASVGTEATEGTEVATSAATETAATVETAAEGTAAAAEGAGAVVAEGAAADGAAAAGAGIGETLLEFLPLILL